MSAIPPEMLRAFASLAAVVYDAGDADETLSVICGAAVRVVPGCDHACVSSLGPKNRLITRAASDDIARLMDQLESEIQQGPCLDSIFEDSFQRDPDIRNGSSWPLLAEATLQRTPVRGMIGYRLRPDAGVPSALNLFSDTPGALTADSADVGALLAAFTSVALSAAVHRETAENLRAGLESNREIGKAVGLLMATHGINDEAAFEVLRSASSRTNTRLAQVAQQITAAHRRSGPGGPGRDDGPAASPSR
jgi:hypothetical protein